MSAKDVSSKRVAWSRAHGGILEASAHQSAHDRARDAFHRLGGVVTPTPVAVHLLNDERLRAWSWRDGSIYLTRGLVERLDVEELAAAIAHEMAHLTGVGDRLSPRRAEWEADRGAREMLREVGLPADALIRMLRKVAASAETNLQREIELRIAALVTPFPEFDPVRLDSMSAERIAASLPGPPPGSADLSGTGQRLSIRY